MFILKDNKTGINVYFKGKINRRPSKIGSVKIETNLGGRKTEHTRAVVDLSIRVDYMSMEDYDNLEKIFMVSNNSIDIQDTDKGRYYSKYYISDDTLEFEEYEDIENNTYYYIGGFQLSKR